MAGPATLDEFLRSGLERSQDERGQPSRLLRPPGLEPRADDPGDAPEDLRDPLESEHRQDAPSRWQCLRCDGLSFHWSDGWRCNGCGSYDFFNAAAPTTRQGGYGTWVYVPRGEPNDPEATSSSSSLPGMPSTWNTSPPPRWAPARRLRVPRPSPDFEAHETAESESLTSDATVDPDTLRALPKLSRRQRRAAAAVAAAAAAGGDGGAGQGQRSPQVPRSDRRDGAGDPPLEVQAASSKTKAKAEIAKTSDAWDSRKGPSPGVKYRGGAPPRPPVWHYSREDIRAFDRWER